MKKITKKLNAKRALCLAFALIMTAGVFTAVFVNTGIKAGALVVDGAGDGDPTPYVVVPETIYLTPNLTSATTFEYYVNNTFNSSNNTVTLDQSAAATSGKVYFKCDGASNVTVSVSGATGISLSPSTLSANYAGTFSGGTLSSGLAQKKTSVITWTFKYTYKNNTYEAKAYTVAYAPFVLPVGAAVYTSNEAGDKGGSTVGLLSWWSGINSVSARPDVNKGADSSDSNTTLYANTAVLNPITDVYTELAGTNLTPNSWLSTSAVTPGDEKTFYYGSYNKSSGSDWASTMTTGYTANITVDTSRNTNLNQIPNLTVGTNLTSYSYNSLSMNSWTVFEYRTKPYTGHYASDENKKKLIDPNAGEYSYGSSVSQISKDNPSAPTTTGLIYYNKPYNYSFNAKSTGDVSFNFASFAQLRGNRKSGLYNYPYSCAATYCPITVHRVDKSQLRTTITNAQKAGYSSDEYTSSTWSSFESALKTAYTALGTPDATANTVNSAKEALNNAITNLKRSTGTATAKYINVENADDHLIHADETVNYNFGDKVTATREENSGYNYLYCDLFDLDSFYSFAASRTGAGVVSVTTSNGELHFTGNSNDSYTSMPHWDGKTPEFNRLYLIPVNPGETYTLSYTASGASSSVFIFTCDKHGVSSSASGYYLGMSGLGNISKTFTVPNDAYYVSFRFGNKGTNVETVYKDIKFTTTKTTVVASRVYGAATLFKFCYEPKPFTVTLNAPDATSTNYTRSITVKMGKQLGSITLPTRTGYKFLGYFDSDNKQYYTDAGVGSVWDKSGNGTLNAHWKAIDYTVTLNDAGATSTNHTKQVTVTYDSPVPNITVPTKTGYNFNGYFTAQNGGGKKYINANGTSAVQKWDIPSTTTLFAYWTIKSWYIDVNGVLDQNIITSGEEEFITDYTTSNNITGYGSFDLYVDNTQIKNDVTDYKSQHPYGSVYKVTDIKEVLGHTYDGFIDMDNRFHKKDEEIVYSVPAESNCYVNLVFHTNHFYVDYYPNGSNITGTMESSDFTYGGNNILASIGYSSYCTITYNYNYGPTDVPHKNGGGDTATSYCNFLGWATSPNGNVVYRNGQNVGNLTAEDNYRFALYAIWDSQTITVPKPARLGYVFGGWYYDPTFTRPVGNTCKPTADVTLYAKWNQVNFQNVVIGYDYENGITSPLVADNASFPANGTLLLGTALNGKELNSSTESTNLRDATSTINNTAQGYEIKINETKKNAQLTFTLDKNNATVTKDVTIYYEYSFSDNNYNQYITGKIDLVPANNVYYEEYEFKVNNSIEPEYSDEFFTPSDWSTVTSKAEPAAKENYSIYGYTPKGKCDAFNGFSNQSAMRAAVSQYSKVSKTIEYEFSGKGFDLYSACGNSTSALMVYVWNVVENGDGTKEYLPVANTAIDTYLSDENLLSDAGDMGKLLRQVPVYHFESTNTNTPDEENSGESPTYLVQVYALWINNEPLATCSCAAERVQCAAEQIKETGLEIDEDIFSLEWMDENSAFNGGEGAEGVKVNLVTVPSNLSGTRPVTAYGIIDGIRVYHSCDPAKADYANGYGEGYLATEKDASFFNLKQFTRNTSVNEYSGYKSAVTDFGADAINEVYLAPYTSATEFGATAFKISNFSTDVNRVMISARAVTGKPVILVRGSDVNGKSIKIHLDSGSEMYYDITDCLTADSSGNAMVYISQMTEPGRSGYAAICSVKITSGTRVNPTGPNAPALVYLSASEAKLALNFVTSTTPQNIVDYSVATTNAYSKTGTGKIIPDEIIVDPVDPGEPDDPVTPGTDEKFNVVKILGYAKKVEVDYKTTVIFHSSVTNTNADAEGAKTVWFVNGANTGVSGESFTLANATKESVVEAKLVNAEGKVISTSDSVTVSPAHGFFQKLIAFFRGLFGKLPVIEKK